MLQEPKYTFNKTTERVIEFKGYNARGDIDDGEMRDMKNLCADEYPSIYQRPERSEYQQEFSQESPYVGGIRQMLAKSHFRDDNSDVVTQRQGLAVIDNAGNFWYNGVKYIEGLSDNCQMVAINTKICFFPDKKFFRLVKEPSESRVGNIDANIHDDVGTVTITGNTDMNYASSTLVLSDDLADLLAQFKVGDAVNINISNDAPSVLRVKGTHDDNGTTKYDVVFMLIQKQGEKYVEMSPLYMGTYATETERDAVFTNLAEGYSQFTVLAEDCGPVSEGNSEALAYKKAVSESRIRQVYETEEEISDFIDTPDGFTPDTAIGPYIKVVYNAVSSEQSIYFSFYFPKADMVSYSEDFDSNETQTRIVQPVSGIISDINGNKLTISDNAFTDQYGEQFDDVTIQYVTLDIDRSSPNLDYVMEHNNRLWGVSNEDNTIYACKLGDPTNWGYFQNTALDSYYAEQGSDGEWTGLAPYSTHLCFFKEDCIHKVYGSYPAEYQIVTAICNGVEKGSQRSLAFMNDSIFYKSRVGIMAYSGGYPQLISSQFGNTKYKNVVAGTDGRRYYACMEEVKTGDHVLMVYDTEYNEWHKQDDLKATCYTYINGSLICAADGQTDLIQIVADDDTGDNSIEWMAMLGPYDEYLEDKKIYSRIKIRYKMPEGSEFKVYISASEGVWEEVAHVISETDRIEEVFVTPVRCDCFSIKIEGKGYCKIKSMVREFRVSSMRKEGVRV